LQVLESYHELTNAAKRVLNDREKNNTDSDFRSSRQRAIANFWAKYGLFVRSDMFEKKEENRKKESENDIRIVEPFPFLFRKKLTKVSNCDGLH